MSLETLRILVRRCMESYSRYTTTIVNVDGNDVIFHRLGHNASHDFYLGANVDGTVLRRSVEPIDCDIDVIDIKPARDGMYLGHW